MMKIREFKNSIEFKNDGQLSLFFLGTGGAFSKKYFQNNALIIKGNSHILIDCGTLCPLAFSFFNSDITQVRNFLLTHNHADHIGGMEEIALVNMYGTKQVPNILITDEFKKILWNESLKGGLKIKGENSAKPTMSFDDYFHQIKPKKIKKSPRPFYEAEIGDINLKIFRTKHIFTDKNNWKNSYYSVGVLIDNKIIYTGDSQADKELIEWLTSEFNIECIFHDCQFGHNAVHTDYEELLKILTPDLRKKTYLCHYSDNADQQKDRVMQDGFAGCVMRGVYYDCE